jgi:hypothetical protein
VAAIEVDDPLGLEPGEKIVTLRSIRNDPLGRLHSHRQIDEAQYQSGRAFQEDWEKAERGPQAVDPTREYVDGGQAREPITERQRKAVLRLNRARARTRRRRLRAGARGAGAGPDHGADRPAPRAARPALDRLFRAAVSRMSGSAGVAVWIRHGAGIIPWTAIRAVLAGGSVRPKFFGYQVNHESPWADIRILGHCSFQDYRNAA